MEQIISNPILLALLIPLIAAPFPLFCRHPRACGTFTALASALTVIVAVRLYGANAEYMLNWAGYGISLALKGHLYAVLTVGAAGFFAFLVSVYSASSMAGKPCASKFFSLMLLALAFVNGAVLSDNIVVTLFFWEGLLVSLYGMITIGGKNSFRSATKAFIIVGISDLLMMAGVAITATIAKTFTISQMGIVPEGLGLLAFLLMMTGAAAKGGCMPFHSWIPDAATAAPLSFMAFFPAAVEKLISIYLLVVISTRIFLVTPGSIPSVVMMSAGAITIVLAVLMALIQKDFKRLLSYHAISQVGYMILGIGTATPIGVAGGIFHMINNALYKSCLFLTGGAVEKQAGTTDLTKLGGIGRKMPVTFACFTLAALAISGVPPFNGFFSKEMIYGAALERGEIFYLAALVGSFFTAASFLKLGHAAFVDKPRSDVSSVKEAPLAMLLPMMVLAAICLVFGIYYKWPVFGYIAPMLGSLAPSPEGHESVALIVISAVVLTAAVVNHIFSVKMTGSGLYASEPVRRAPVMSKAYDLADRKLTDPYTIGGFFIRILAIVLWKIDRANDWLYNAFAGSGAMIISGKVRALHRGQLALYAAWAVIGAIAVIVIMMGAGK